MWDDGGVRSFEDLGEKGFREGFGFFSGEGETCGSDLKMLLTNQNICTNIEPEQTFVRWRAWAKNLG